MKYAVTMEWSMKKTVILEAEDEIEATTGAYSAFLFDDQNTGTYVGTSWKAIAVTPDLGQSSALSDLQRQECEKEVARLLSLLNNPA